MASDTKSRILDAAERFFGSLGFAETSLRALTREAGTNLAAVNYHFGSKEGLFRAVVQRLVGSLNEERLRRLAELEGRAETPSLEELMRAFLGPALELGADGDRGERMRQLMGRLRFEGGPTDEPLREVFREVEERFGPALRNALPHLEPKTFFWRMSFTLGVMCSTLFNPRQVHVISRGACEPDVEEALDQMVSFVAAGLRAEPRSEDQGQELLGPQSGPSGRRS